VPGRIWRWAKIVQEPPVPGANSKFSRRCLLFGDCLAVSDSPLKVLAVADAPPSWACEGLRVEWAREASRARHVDAVIFEASDRMALDALFRRADLQQAAYDAAVIVLAPQATPAEESALMRQGVQDVLAGSDPATLFRALRLAVERKRLEHASRLAYATDLATGLPHQAQLLEHMTQLLALRERDPAPMVLIVLRIEGLSSTALRLGLEAANILRRKVAVRLRGGLRASDVVAATGPESFGVLLGHIESAGDGEKVVAKLLQTLKQPFLVAGQTCAVAVAAGMACYPEHGKEAKELLQRATAQAASVAAIGREGFATHAERGAARAANDEGGGI
jgi:diguanylate cyclase (GGDEF)-like protein